MLNYLNNKFLNSKLKTKIELYILPLLVFYFVFYSFQSTKEEIFQTQTKIDINSYSNKEFKDSFLELFSTIEEFASKNQITILGLTNNKKVITLKAKTQLVNMEKLIKKIENLNNFTNIKLLTLTKENLENYKVEIQIDLSKFYIKKIEEELDIPLIEQNEEVTDIQENKEFKINGIIQNYAFINDTWLTVNDLIDDYKLIIIEKDFVVLKNKNKEIKLELIDENSIKNFN
jgi:hypothetical protein